MPDAFTTAEAAERGYGRGRLRGPAVRRELYGAYLTVDGEPSEQDRIAPALLVLPAGSATDSTTALGLDGVDLEPAGPLRFVSDHPHQGPAPQVAVRRSMVLPASVGDVDGVRTLRPAAAFVSAARHLDLVSLVAAGDWLVRLELASPADLVDAATSASGRGSRAARRAAGLVRERVDSVQETRLRLAITFAGLPEPDVNHMVWAQGRPVGRVDLLLWACRTVIEYEGDQHQTDRAQWNRDIRRQEQLVGDGHRLVRVTAERMRSPRAVVLPPTTRWSRAATEVQRPSSARSGTGCSRPRADAPPATVAR